MRKLPGLSYTKSTAHSSNTTHREHTVRQLKYSRRYCNSTAAYTTHRNCSAVHTPSIANTQRVSSNIANTQLRTSSIAIHRSARQASQIHSESAQILRVCSDTDVVQPLVHIANPSIASTQRVSSNVTNTQLRTSSIAIHRSTRQASQIHNESAQRLRVYSDIAVVQLLAHIANPSIANTQRVGSDIATQDIDLEVRSVDGEELGCEPSRADSDRQKAAAGAP